jgi:hypothetical protein
LLLLLREDYPLHFVISLDSLVPVLREFDQRDQDKGDQEKQLCPSSARSAMDASFVLLQQLILPLGWWE